MPPSKKTKATVEFDLPEGGRPAHPLFPPQNEDDEPPEVVSFQITRWNKVTAQQEWCLRTFPASEFTDLQQIQELFGGGRYEFLARGSKSRLTARRTYTLPGKSKPLYDSSGEESEETESRSTLVPQPAAPAAPAFGANITGLLPALLPVALEYLKTSAQERAAQFAATQQMMMAVMNSQQASSQAFVTAMSQLFQRPAQAGGGIQDFRAGIEFAENILEAKLEAMKGEGGDSSQEMMALVQQGLNAFQLLKSGTPPANGVPPNGATS